MLRTITGGLLGLIALVTLPPCSGQTGSDQSRSRRLDAAESDIESLKRLVKQQGLQIAELEKTIKSLQAASTVPSETPTAHEVAKTIFKPAAGWQNPLAWTQIRKGLSRAQVEEILGPPTSVESVLDYQTLSYKGNVPGSGAVAGLIKLTDDRVSEVSPPAF